MGLCNELSCEVRSFSHCCNPYRFFQSEILWLYFPALEPWVVQSVSLLSCSSWLISRKYGTAHFASHHPPCPPASDLLRVLSAWLSVSAPPTGLCECFFFNPLVVRLPYNSIFLSVRLFFVFKFIVVLLWVVQGVTVCLPMPHLGQITIL